MKMSSRAWLALSVSLASSLFAQSNAPAVNNAAADFTKAPATLTINGLNLGNTKPTIALGGAALTVESFSPTKIVADLPAGTTPGSYHLVVTNNDNQSKSSTALDVTIGTAGPQGPAGPQGATGPGGP